MIEGVCRMNGGKVLIYTLMLPSPFHPGPTCSCQEGFPRSSGHDEQQTLPLHLSSLGYTVKINRDNRILKRNFKSVKINLSIKFP